MPIEYENAQHLHREHPQSFEVPAADDLARIRPGDLVKVCARGAPGKVCAERFWVQVHGVDGDTITGEVNNHVVSHPLKAGDVITFKAENVYGITKVRPQ